MIFRKLFYKHVTAVFLVSFWFTTTVLAYCVFDKNETAKNTHDSDHIQSKNSSTTLKFQSCVDQCSEQPDCDFLAQTKALRTKKLPVPNLKPSKKYFSESTYSGDLSQSKSNLITRHFDFKAQQSLFAQKTSLLIYH